MGSDVLGRRLSSPDALIWICAPVEAAAANLKLGFVLDDRPVQLTLELRAPPYRDLILYGPLLIEEVGQKSVEVVS